MEHVNNSIGAAKRNWYGSNNDFIRSLWSTRALVLEGLAELYTAHQREYDNDLGKFGAWVLHTIAERQSEPALIDAANYAAQAFLSAARKAVAAC